MNNDINSELENSQEKKGTTVLLMNDAYKLIRDKQSEIYKITGKTFAVQDIASKAVEKGIELVSFE